MKCVYVCVCVYFLKENDVDVLDIHSLIHNVTTPFTKCLFQHTFLVQCLCKCEQCRKFIFSWRSAKYISFETS